MFALCRTHLAGVLIAQGKWPDAEGVLAEAIDELLATHPAMAAEGMAHLAMAAEGMAHLAGLEPEVYEQVVEESTAALRSYVVGGEIFVPVEVIVVSAAEPTD